MQLLLSVCELLQLLLSSLLRTHVPDGLVRLGPPRAFSPEEGVMDGPWVDGWNGVARSLGGHGQEHYRQEVYITVARNSELFS
jgi:hypothetical protein